MIKHKIETLTLSALPVRDLILPRTAHENGDSDDEYQTQIVIKNHHLFQVYFVMNHGESRPVAYVSLDAYCNDCSDETYHDYPTWVFLFQIGFHNEQLARRFFDDVVAQIARATVDLEQYVNDWLRANEVTVDDLDETMDIPEWLAVLSELVMN